MKPIEPGTGKPWILSSQVGYDLGDSVCVMVRGNRREHVPSDARLVLLPETGGNPVEVYLGYWGEKWSAHWWIADATHLVREGRYATQLVEHDYVLATGDRIVVSSHRLWDECFHTISRDYLATRSNQARTGMGWKDCGSDLQEFSSHAVCTDGICDLLEVAGAIISRDDQTFLLDQLLRGCGYMARLQDRARDLGLGDGCVVHEDRDTDVVTGNVAKAAAIFARVSRLIKQHNPQSSIEYLDRGKRAFAWIEDNGPVMPQGAQDFFPHVHGAPVGSSPPDGQWMTRDLVMMARAAVELFRAGETDYKSKAVFYARAIMNRQVSEAQTEEGLFGHFFTYEDFSAFGGVRFTEKANIHCGAWSTDGRIYNKGGHYPHYLLPLIDMLSLWPDHPEASAWKHCLSQFCFGYLIPACERNPFTILPAGYYTGAGLMNFGCWYHAHNNIYAFTASLALELERIFGDRRLRDIAVANVQWIAGSNCGLAETAPEGSVEHPNADHDEARNYVPVSMIYGIGERSRGSWSKIPGSVCNGFSASRQFTISPITTAEDIPEYFDDEAYIAHSLPFLAAVARLTVYHDRCSS